MVDGKRRGVLSAKRLPVANAAEINTMQRVLTAYCRQRGITARVDRERISERLLQHLDSGLTDEQTLLAELILEEDARLRAP
jgi:hypothetical protein